MKEIFIKHIDKLKKKFTINQKKNPKKVTLHNTNRDNYRCKRKQLSIRFSQFQHFKHIFEYKSAIIATLVIITLSWIAFLLYWPVYTVKFINIIRQDSITNIDLAYNALSDIRGKRILEIQDSLISQKIYNYQNNIQVVDIDINFPNTLEIYLLSYPVYFQTIIGEKSFYITQNGALVPGKPNTEYKTMILKNGVQSNVFPDYKKFFEQEDIQNMYEAVYYFEQNIVGTQIKNILYYQTQREVHFELENGNIIIYTLEKDLKPQIKKTAIFHTEHKQISDDNLIYLDMRISNKIFYCDDENQRQCNLNLKKIYPQ